MKTFFRTVMGLSLLSGLLTAPLVGAEKPEEPKQGKGQSLNKAAQTKNNAILNINNFTTWMRADGNGQNPPDQNFNGSQFPRGTSHPIFADGFVWGGKAYLDAARTQPAPIQLIRVGGSTYNVGNQVGWINGTGASAVAVSISNARARIYRIRRDYTTMAVEELRRDAAENNQVGVSSVTDADVATVVQQYATDWDEWPTDLGAPYIERNNTAGYQKPHVVNGKAVFDATFTVDDLISGNYDEPGVAGTDPKSPANQVIWTVFNDLNVTNMNSFAGSLPMGLEGQITLWGYKRGDALGNLYFNRIKLINKGGADVGGGAKGALYIDSMFVCQWSDPDLGNAGDDLSGCDSALGVGFVYNGNAVDADYARFNLPPPAIGYDFLAGPIVAGAPTDTAIFDLKKKGGFKNLPMTSFSWFAASNTTASDPPFSYEGALRWWKLLRGYIPNPSTASDLFYPGPPGAPATRFPLGGDPFKGTGSLDGLGTTYSSQPGDRRLVLSSGPFLLAPQDTQEVTMGVVAGLGGDRLSSVAIMKANDAAVQTTFNLVFQVSQAPASPIVTATELDGKVIIDWGSNLNRVKATETTISQPGSYTFEGYNLYQLPLANSPRSEWKRIATYDVVNTTAVILDTEFDLTAGQFLSKAVQFGTNSGVKRYFELDRDYARDIGAVYNGQQYYLVVTAYSRATVAGFAAALESSPIVTTVTPKKSFGFTTNSKLGTGVPVTKVGLSDGSAVALVISPTAITGNSYQIRFDSSGGTWRVVNTTKNTTLLTGETNQNADDASPIVEGVQIRVSGAPNDAKDFLHVAGPTGPINPPSYASFSTFNSWGFPDPTGGATGGSPSATDWGGGRWGIHTGGAGAAGDESYTGRFVPRVFRNDNFDRFVPYDFEIRFVDTTTIKPKAYLAFTTGTVVTVPFELWNIGVGTPNDPSDDFRMIPWINDADGNEAFNLQQVDHALSGSDNDPYTDWIYWHDPVPKSPGSAGYNAFASDPNYDAGGAVTGTGGEVMARVVLVNVNGGSVSAVNWPANANSLMPATGNVIRIISTKPNTPAVVFNYSTASFAASKSAELEKTSASRIGVFPNPYYAFNPAETNRFVRFVTFNNLPRVAKVRILNLAGQLVRTLDKDDNSQFLRWDLNNGFFFPVASGIYIAYIEATLSDGSVFKKIVKIAIIQEQEVPDVF